jgi:hypothetical protein
MLARPYWKCPVFFSDWPHAPASSFSVFQRTLNHKQHPRPRMRW